MAAFLVLELTQHLVRVPTPRWQALAIVTTNTIAVAVLDYLDGSNRFTLAFYMLNIAFATVAFGRTVGIVTAVMSVAILALIDFLNNPSPRPKTEWPLVLSSC